MVSTTGSPLSARNSTRVAPPSRPKSRAGSRSVPTRSITSASARAFAKAPIRSGGMGAPAGSTSTHPPPSNRDTTVRPPRVRRTSRTSPAPTETKRGRALTDSADGTRRRSTSQYSAPSPARTTYAIATGRQRMSVPAPADDEHQSDQREDPRLRHRGGPEDRAPLLGRHVELLQPQLLPARPVADRLGLAREPVDRVHEQVLVAEVLNKEVPDKFGVAVEDDPPLPGGSAGGGEGPERGLEADRPRPGVIAARHERG